MSKRGKKLSTDEFARLANMANEGETTTAIAKALGRDPDTISKYRKSLDKDSKLEDSRIEALKHAQAAHWAELAKAPSALLPLFKLPHVDAIARNWELPTLKDAEELLLDALREYHAPDAHLWSHWDEWKGARRDLLDAVGSFHERASVMMQGSKVETIVASFPQEVTRSWLRSATGNDQEPSVLKPTGEKRPPKVRLLHGPIRVAEGADKRVKAAHDLFHQILDHEQSRRLSLIAGAAYKKLEKLRSPLRMAVVELSLHHGFPGECRFCPLRATKVKVKVK